MKTLELFIPTIHAEGYAFGTCTDTGEGAYIPIPIAEAAKIEPQKAYRFLVVPNRPDLQERTQWRAVGLAPLGVEPGSPPTSASVWGPHSERQVPAPRPMMTFNGWGRVEVIGYVSGREHPVRPEEIVEHIRWRIGLDVADCIELASFVPMWLNDGVELGQLAKAELTDANTQALEERSFYAANIDILEVWLMGEVEQ